MKKPFWKDGLKFECQGSGGCCVSRGGYGYVWMTLEDRRRMAGTLNLSTASFTKKYCVKENEVWKLKEGVNGNCLFLKAGKCQVYQGRPTQCRTWPFWPEALQPKTWNSEIATFCPGIGKGRLWSAEEIRKTLEDQKRSESHYGS